MSNFIQAQQVLLDLAQQQNRIVMNGVKERVGDSTAAIAMEHIPGLPRLRIRRTITSQVPAIAKASRPLITGINTSWISFAVAVSA